MKSPMTLKLCLLLLAGAACVVLFSATVFWVWKPVNIEENRKVPVRISISRGCKEWFASVKNISDETLHQVIVDVRGFTGRDDTNSRGIRERLQPGDEIEVGLMREVYIIAAQCGAMDLTVSAAGYLPKTAHRPAIEELAEYCRSIDIAD